MRIQLIRHGATAGNEKRQYIGRTDEVLSPKGLAQLRQYQSRAYYDTPGLLYTSPMRRCLQTCALLFPTVRPLVEDALRETDFGLFEGKSYAELQAVPAYQQWLDSGCTACIPQGESRAQFQNRCCDAFLTILQQHRQLAQLTFVVHGGVIMAILERFAQPKQDFYQYHVENGGVCFYQWDSLWPVTLLREER